MGICSSAAAAAVATATVKLIHDDGRLQEFPYPVKVSYVLQKNPACFICNSDEMEFNDIVSAVSDDEELQLGHLYFALPLSRLSRSLKAEEMAALAVKASSALRRSSANSQVIFSVKSENAGQIVPRRRRTSGGGAGGRGKVAARLSGIPE